MIEVRTARYADGWADAVVNPMTSADAAARDAGGRPYAVLLRDAGRLRAVLHIAWADAYCAVTVLGDDGRRRAVLHLRRTPEGDLFLHERRTWPDGDGPEDAHRITTTWTLAGRRQDNDEPRGARGGSSRGFAEEAPPRVAVPGFGDWSSLVELAGLGAATITEDTADDLPVTRADTMPWAPPRPAAPGDFALLFTAGAHTSFGRHRAVMEQVAAGPLRLTSGRLVAADPAVYPYDLSWFTVTVNQGVYPMTVAVARFVEQPDHRRVAAARLAISDRPVVRWELALQDGQSALDLGANEFYGFGVDTGLGSFADADVWEAVRALDDDERDAWEDDWIGHGETVGDRLTLTVGDGEVVAWASGWGDGTYPTWIGRDDAGEVACFVADMRL